MFLELYYKDYPNLCEPSRRSLPYSIIIRSPEQRKMFEEMLRKDGFQCVVSENGYPCMYVNFTLKRYGRSMKPCASGSINAKPTTQEEFMDQIYSKYLHI